MLAFATTSFGQWTTIITDAAGDATMSGLDGTTLEYQYDQANEKVRFRITCANLATHSSSPSADFSFALPNGLVSGNPSGVHWTSTTPVHKTSYIYADNGGSAPSNYTFTSWANRIEESASLTILCASACVDINVDVPNNQITYTFDRTDIITDAEMAGSSATIGLVMNVGNNVGWADAITHASGGASASSFTITQTITSIEESSKLRLHPNPSSDVLNLQSDLNFSSIIIHDATGREVVHQNTNLTQVNVSNLKEGMYFLSTFNKDLKLIKSTRFIKK